MRWLLLACILACGCGRSSVEAEAKVERAKLRALEDEYNAELTKAGTDLVNAAKANAIAVREKYKTELAEFETQWVVEHPQPPSHAALKEAWEKRSSEEMGGKSEDDVRRWAKDNPEPSAADCARELSEWEAARVAAEKAFLASRGELLEEPTEAEVKAAMDAVSSKYGPLIAAQAKRIDEVEHAQ